MDIPVKLRVNNVDISVTGTLTIPTLPEHNGLCYRGETPIVIEYDMKFQEPSDTIYLICIGNAYKIIHGKEAANNYILQLVRNNCGVSLVGYCPGDKKLAEELQRKYQHREKGELLELKYPEVTDIKELMAYALLRNNTKSPADNSNVTELPTKQSDIIQASSAPKSFVTFSRNPVLSAISFREMGISTGRGRSRFPDGSRGDRVPDFGFLFERIDINRVRTGSYSVEELESFLRAFIVSFTCRLGRNKLQSLLVCLVFAYQNMIHQCTVEELKDFLTLFGYKTDNSEDLGKRVSEFLGLKDLITIDVNNLQNCSEEDIDKYIEFFDLSKNITEKGKIDTLLRQFNRINSPRGGEGCLDLLPESYR